MCLFWSSVRDLLIWKCAVLLTDGKCFHNFMACINLLFNWISFLLPVLFFNVVEMKFELDAQRKCQVFFIAGINLIFYFKDGGTWKCNETFSLQLRFLLTKIFRIFLFDYLRLKTMGINIRFQKSRQKFSFPTHFSSLPSVINDANTTYLSGLMILQLNLPSLLWTNLNNIQWKR